MYCIIVNGPDQRKIIGPFNTAQAAALWAANQLILRPGTTAVVAQLLDPKAEEKPDGR